MLSFIQGAWQHFQKVFRFMLRGPNAYLKKTKIMAQEQDKTVVLKKSGQPVPARAASIFHKGLLFAATVGILIIPLVQSSNLINIFPKEKDTKAAWNNARQTCDKDQFCVYVYDFSIQAAFRSYGGIKYLTPGQATFGNASEYQFNYNDAIFKLGPPSAAGVYRAWIHGLNSNYYVVTNFNGRSVPQWISDTNQFNPTNYPTQYDPSFIYPYPQLPLASTSAVGKTIETTGGNVTDKANRLEGQWVFLFVDQFATQTPLPTATVPPGSTSTFTPTFTSIIPVSTSTFTHTAVNTNTFTNTPTRTVTGTPPNTATFTETFTQTPTRTATGSPTSTGTPVFTFTSTPTFTATPSPTSTRTPGINNSDQYYTGGSNPVADLACHKEDLTGNQIWMGNQNKSQGIFFSSASGRNNPPQVDDGVRLVVNNVMITPVADQFTVGASAGDAFSIYIIPRNERTSSFPINTLAWIDWDRNAVKFPGDGDLYYTNGAPLNASSSTLLPLTSTTIPISFNFSGSVLLRVRITDSSIRPDISDTSCLQNGEVEDYLINFTAPFTATPTATTTLTATASTTFTPSLTATITRTPTISATSTTTLTATLTSTSTVTLTSTITTTPAWGFGDWSNDYYGNSPKLPAAMHRDNGVDGQWIGRNVTYENGVNSPGEAEDGILLNGASSLISPPYSYTYQYNVFPVSWETDYTVSTCYRFHPINASDTMRNYVIAIWVDWNGDGVLDNQLNSREKYVVSMTNRQNQECLNPSEYTSLPGINLRAQMQSVGSNGGYRAMRVRAYPQGTDPNAVLPSGPYDNGEVEDYMLFIDNPPTATVTATASSTATVTSTPTTTNTLTATPTLAGPRLFQIEKTPGIPATCGNPGDIVRVLGNNLEDMQNQQAGTLYFQYGDFTITLPYSQWYNNAIINAIFPNLPIIADQNALIWAVRQPDGAASNSLTYCFNTPTPTATTSATITATATTTSTRTATNTRTPSVTTTYTPSSTFTITNTSTATATGSQSATSTATLTPTQTFTGTVFSPTNTSTSTSTFTATSTQATATSTATASLLLHEVLIRVKDNATTNAIVDALVRLYGDNVSYDDSGRTDGYGEILFRNVPNGRLNTHIETCSKNFDYSFSLYNDDPARITKTYYVDCVNSYTVRVHVQNPYGTPIANATVTLDGTIKYTDSSGIAQYTGILAATYTAYGRYNTDEGSRTFTVPGELDPVITLGGVHRVTIRTIDDATSNPIPNVKVEYRPAAGTNPQITDNLGQAYFINVPNGSQWVYITYCDYNQWPMSFTLSPSDPEEVVITYRLSCAQTYNVTVHVHNSKGAVIPGATVSMSGTTVTAQTDSNGRVIFTNVPKGDYIATASKNGRSNNTSFNVPADLDVEIILDMTNLPATGMPLSIGYFLLLLFVISFLGHVVRKELKKTKH